MNIRNIQPLLYKFLRVLSICIVLGTLIWFYHYSQSREPTLVSVIQLIAIPEKYHHKNIKVVGFLRLEFEGNSLYPLQEFDRHGLLYNQIWLDIDRETSLSRRNELDSNYALIEGIFDAKSHGHRGLSVGTIHKITRMQKWSDRDQSLRDLYEERIGQ